MTRRGNAILALALGFPAGAALPFVQVYLECRAAASEACVWGKALLPVTVSISAVFVGAFIALAIFGVLESRRRPVDEEDAKE